MISIKEIEQYTEKIFEEIKHLDEEGNEYWEARELMTILEYSKWENFNNVIKKHLFLIKIAITMSYIGFLNLGSQ